MKYKISKMPKIALGTWENTEPHSIDEVVESALTNGYKHIDTAQIYGNEHMIGSTLKKLNIKREDYWITTKIWPSKYKDQAYESIKESLKKLQTDYVDAILLHMPSSNKKNLIAFKEALRAKKDGLVRTVGVSNFSIEQINYLFEQTGEYPDYNQIIASVIQRMDQMEQFAQEKGITLMGYSSIRPYYNPNPLFPNSGLTNIQKQRIDQLAKNYNVTPAIILQNFVYNKGYVILPKSTKGKRVIENYRATENILSKSEIKELESWNSFDDIKMKQFQKKKIFYVLKFIIKRKFSKK